jgi:Fe2+ or Zn2+ uptake regulation protein
MSSKEQFKDALKQQARVITEQRKEIADLKEKYKDVLANNRELYDKMYKLGELLNTHKRWWQFWK